VHCGVGALFHDGKEVGEESVPTCCARFNIAANGSKINRLLLIMVVGAGFCCMHWVCYAVLYIGFCTVEVVD